MVSDNEALRLRRLVFYAQDTDRFNATLLGFVRKANAQAAMLIDREGHMVARQGFKQSDNDSQALAALVAGSFATTQQVAKLLGEADFRTLSHQGSDHSIHVTLIGERTLQVAVFATAVKAGMIQVFCKELATQMEAILADAATRQAAEPADKQPLGKDFSDAMKDQLDNLFGNL
jgi:predicted regulator of Ras-like GTPase activity (Roadblock/LC7/MglB family)